MYRLSPLGAMSVRLPMGFFAADFLAVFFFAADFLVPDFFAADFFDADFFEADFFVAEFFDADFLAPDFFAAMWEARVEVMPERQRSCRYGLLIDAPADSDRTTVRNSF